MRFSRILKTAFFAIVMAFGLSNAYSASSICPSGYKVQTNLFADLQHCGVSGSVGYEHTGNASTSDASTNTWISYFPSFRVKGRSYCSTTAPGDASQDVACPSIPRRPMADAINTSGSGRYCWCQATEHQAFSTVSNSWAAPFQKIYAKYVFLKDMGSSCQSSCAEYCSYMTKNFILDGSTDNPVIGVNLRATIYDSLLQCMPIENKITYISDGDIIDYQYYTGNSVTLKDEITKSYYSFKGWCETETCSNPMSGGSVKTGWSGEKTLYAQWELSGCENGLKTQYVNGTLTCTTECADGYEEQFNPFRAEYSSAPNEGTYCARKGNGSETNGTNWTASFSSYGYMVKGESYCSATAPLESTGTFDEACEMRLLPMLESIDTETSGQHCWCRATEYDQLVSNSTHTAYVVSSSTPLDSKYVYTTQLQRCSVDCPSLCGAMWGQNIFYGVVSVNLRTSIYRSLKKCQKTNYTLTLKDGEQTIDIMDYSVSDTVDLPVPSTVHTGYEFVGWCEDLNDCPDPMVGEQTGLFGNKTLYAKWVPEPYPIEYSLNGTTLTKSAPMTYTVDRTVVLDAPIVEDGYEFDGWVDETSGQDVEVLPTNTIKSGTARLAARVSVRASSAGNTTGSGSGSTSGLNFDSVTDYTIPATCDAGYEHSNIAGAVLDPKKDTNATITAHISGNNQSKKMSSFVPDIKNDGTSPLGVWGLLYAAGYNSSTQTVSNPFYWVYGESSCNGDTGGTPPDNLVYSNGYHETMNGQDNNGQNCWCRMTDYQIYNNEKQTNLQTPWVYLQMFNTTELCSRNCAPACRAAMVSNAFFRSQVFGDYSACKPKEYTITYELNGGHWTGNEPETTYTIVYHDVTVPNTVAREGFEFAGWCEGVNNPKSSACHAANETLTIPTGSSGDKTYYARWKTTINFYAGTVAVENNVPFPMSPKDVYYKETNITSPQNTFNRNGYSFTGWRCVAKDNNNNDVILEYPDQGKITSYDYNSGMTCTAQWDTVNYSINYNNSNNNITFSDAWYWNQTFTYTIESDPITISDDATAQDNHYDFAGWCVGENDNCNDNALVQTYTIPSGSTGDVYLWAHWQVAKYDITYYGDIEDYNANPQVPLTSEQITSYGLPATYTYGTEQELPPLTMEHYDFLGWYYSDNLNGNAITSIVAGTEGNKTLVAKWEPHTYTITYYKDSTKTDNYTGDGYVTEYTVEDNNITPLPTPTETYFEFDGWTNCSDDNVIDTIYTANGGDRELCATWIRVSCPDGSYLVNQTCYSCATETSGVYPYSDGTTATDISACYTTCPATPTCPEHSENCAYDIYVGGNNMFFEKSIATVINNYYHEEDGEMLLPCGVTYDCMERYHHDDSGTTCEPDIYNVTYYDGETSIEALSTDFGSYTYGTGLTLPTVANIGNYYTKPHYTFVGWHRNPDLSDEAVTEISTSDAGAKVFYSEWEPTVYKIQFLRGTEGDGGTMTYQEAKFEQSVTLNPNGFTATGHTFDKWLCTATYESGETFNGEYQDQGTIASYDFNSDMECTAKWNPNQYSLTYNCNGGTLAVSNNPVTVYYNREYVLDSSVCTKDNHSISSWSCTNGFNPTSSSKWNITNDSTCTANWTETEYTITYKEKDGTVLSNLLPKKYRSSQTPVENVPTSNPPATDHFEFAGWCDDVNLTQNCALTREIPLNHSGNVVFYAKWNATGCPAGQYLDNGQCLTCESPFTSDAWTATQATDCYYDCNVVCPDNASTCTFTGIENGFIHYGSGISISSCQTNMVFDCERGYKKNANSCVLDTYNINYHNMEDASWESNAIHPISYTIESSLITISEPVRDWYRFDGWCVDNDDCNTPTKSFVINPEITIGNIDLYAQWTFNGCRTGYVEQDTATGTTCVPRYYHITYIDGGQELPNFATEFTIEDELISLPSMTKHGYTFNGWCVNDSLCTPNQIVKGSITGPWTVGNKVLYAQWSKNEFVCDSNKFLHIGNDKACLITTKPSSPALAIRKGNQTYYLYMTQDERLKMNEKSNKRLKILYEGDIYNVHDDSSATK